MAETTLPVQNMRVPYFLIVLAAVFAPTVNAKSSPEPLRFDSAKAIEACQTLANNSKALKYSVLVKKAKARNVWVRIVRQDGEGLPVTMDFRQDRLSVELIKGRVSAASCN